MRRLSLAGAVVAAVALVALAAVTLQSAAPTANAQILPPSRFYGTVTVDGTAATSGTLNGLIGGKVCGTASINPGLGNGLNYDIQVKDSSEEPNCGSLGATVTFELVDGGTAACSPTGSWNSANVQLLNLTCAHPTPTPTATATASPTPTATAVPTATATATATVTVTPKVIAGTGGTPGGDSFPLGLLLAGILGLAVVGSGAWALSRSRR